MARSRKPKTTEAAITTVDLDKATLGKAVEEGATFPLGGNDAHANAGVVAELPSEYIDPKNFVVEDDARSIPAANQKEIDTDLAVNIFIYGQKQPSVTYPDPIEDTKRIGVTGHTRARAVQMIRDGFEAVDPRTGEMTKFHDANRPLWIVVDRTKSKEDAFVDGLITNIKQNKLTPVQEALAVKRLTDKHEWTLTQAAALFGYNNTNRQNKLLTLLELGSEIVDRVHNGEMSLDAAVSLKGVKPEKRIKLVTQATGNDGKVDGAKLRGILRDVYSAGDEEVKNLLDPQYGYSTELGNKPETTEEEGDEPVKGGKKAEKEEPPAGVNLKRNKAHFDAFADSILNDEESDMGEPAKELLKAFKKWFTGVKFGDTALKNALKTHCKAK